MKNTFLHVDCPDVDTLNSESPWNRQRSEPAPMLRQVSSAMPPKLERIPSDGGFASDDGSDREEDNIAEQDSKSDLSDIDDFDDLNDASLNRQVSSIKRQISEMSAGGKGFDRQISSLSAAGFCRQVTEQQWPSYSNTGPASMHSAMNGIEPIMEAKGTPSMDSLPSMDGSLEDSTGSTPNQPYPEIPACDPQALASMLWPGTSWNGVGDFSSLLPPLPQKNYNRRKARSLVTQAQEAQRAQQLAMMQMQLQQKQMMIMNLANSAHSMTPEQMKLLETEIQNQWKCMMGLSMHAAQAQQQNIPPPADRREKFEQKQEIEQRLKEALGVQADIPQGIAEQAEVPRSNAGTSFDFRAKAVPANTRQDQAQVAAAPGAWKSNPSTTMEAKFCSDCGGRVQQSYKFCKYCGSPTA